MKSHLLRAVGGSGGGGGIVIARPVSIGNWDGGAYTDIDEVTANNSDFVYTWDTTGTNEVQTVTVGFGSLSIASSGDCVLRLREAQMSSGSIETNTSPARRVIMNNFSLGGYTLTSPSSFYMSTGSTWTTRTWTFDASNISSGSITFSAVINNNNNKGGGISWIEFEYPSA